MLGLFRTVAVTVVYLRQNIVQAVLGELVRVSQATVSRIIIRLAPLVADALEQFVPDAATATSGRVVLTAGYTAQVLSDLDGELHYLTQAYPGPCTTSRSSAAQAWSRSSIWTSNFWCSAMRSAC